MLKKVSNMTQKDIPPTNAKISLMVWDINVDRTTIEITVMIDPLLMI